ncbi:MAG: hypothetical protein IKU34_09350 [Clostridia bacterium]|nr:hypothetical protein [Clostridia bacterium]
MLRNPDLEPNVLWTLTDAPETTDNTIQIKEKDRSYYLVRKLYPADEYERILRQAAEYSIYFESDMKQVRESIKIPTGIRISRPTTLS